jgi:Subtilase family
MRRESTRFRPVRSVIAGLIATLSAVGIAATPGSLSFGWQSRVTPQVQQVVGAALGNNSSPPKIAGSTARFDSKNRLHIDVELDCAHPVPTASLVAAGMVIGTTVNVPPMCVVEGWASTSSIAALASVPNVKKVDLPKYSRSHPPLSPRSGLIGIGAAVASATSGTPAIDGNGVTIMNADKYIQQTGKRGASVTIGVISDDVTNLAVIQSRGELPASINVVTPSANPASHPTLTDEGTMMLEEVYAVAPGANLAFCGPATYTEYLACVTKLIAAGTAVISDDLSFTGFDVMSASSQNAAAQALANILTANPTVMLLTAAGNNAKAYWQGSYNPFQLQGGATCAPNGQVAQTDNYFQQFGSAKFVTWQTNGGSTLYLTSVTTAGQAAANQFDLYLIDLTTSQQVACATSSSGGTAGSTSYTIIQGNQIPNGNYAIFVGTTDGTLNTAFLKLIGTDDGGGTFSPVTAGAANSPQDFVAGVIAVGAVSGIDGIGGTIELYSNTGPVQIEVPTQSTLQAPLLVAPDAIYVDNSGTLFVTSGGIFSGTSAASPNTAAVAVLLRSAFPSLTPAQITTYMQAGATQLGASSPSGTFGYGRVDALGALAAIPGPTLSGLQSASIVGGGAPAAIQFAVGGTGALGVSTAPSVSLTSGSATVSISPLSCGNPTAACTLTVTPGTGSYGTANIQVVVRDGANRSVSVPVVMAVTKPPAPTVTLTSGASQSVTVNAAIAPVMFTLTGTGSLVVTPTTSNVSGLTITSGCGTTTMTCTANMGTASSAAGTATLAITVQDAYVQTASATATVTETVPPSKGGGGGMDRWTLLVLGLLVMSQAHRSNRRMPSKTPDSRRNS